MKMKINLQFTWGLVSNFTQNMSCLDKKTKWLLFHKETIGISEYFKKHIRGHIQQFPNSPLGWPLVPEFAGSNPAEAVGFFG